MFFFSFSNGKSVKDFRTKLHTAHRDDVFRITVNVHNAYKKIFKIKTYHKGRVRHVLYSGWTSVLSTFVSDKMKLPCCLRWKTGNVRKNDIICKGHCTVDGCDTTIECVAVQKELSFKIENFDANHFHDPDVKRRILHIEGSKYQAMLRGRSAFAVHCELADQLIDDNESDIETEPLVLPKMKALREIKYKTDALKEKPIFALLTLKKRYLNAISFIGLDPFCIMYSTKLQRVYYKGEGHRMRTCISIDATGPAKYKKVVDSLVYECSPIPPDTLEFLGGKYI